MWLKHHIHIKIDSLVVTNPSTNRAAKQFTKKSHLVIVTTQDPAPRKGEFDSLAFPCNVTDIYKSHLELSGNTCRIMGKEAEYGDENGHWKSSGQRARLYDVEAETLRHNDSDRKGYTSLSTT